MAEPSRFTPDMYRYYQAEGYWDSTTFADVWDANAGMYPDREAVVDSRTRLTWKQAKQWIDRLAIGFREDGFTKDDVLVVQLPNSVELTLLRVAAEKAGLLCVPALRTLRHREMEHIVKLTGAKGIVVLSEYRDFNYLDMLSEIRPQLSGLQYVYFAGDTVPAGGVSLKRRVETPAEQRYFPDYLSGIKMPWNEYSTIAHTSGTTGFPKFVEHPICSLMSLGKATVRAYNLTSNDVVAALSPAAFGPSLLAHVCAPIAGSKIVMQEHFEAEQALQIIEREKVTAVGAVPAQLAMIAACPNLGKYNLRSLRFIRCTGSPLPYHIAVNVEEKMKTKIVQCYGAVDYGTISGSSYADTREVRLATVGKPYPGSEVKLVDESGNEALQGEIGEVWARGGDSVSGYFKDPESTKQTWPGGWYRTGDLGRFDAEGHLIVAGRKKDMIIRGGQNVYPAEIEALLVSHPKISAAAVVGMPDEILGEKACAFVVPKPGQDITLQDMVAFLKEKEIAPFKIPERMETIDKLPMVADDQKVDKKLLARTIAEKLAAEK